SNLLDLSPSEVASQVRDALRRSSSSSKSGEPSWQEVNKAVVIIDADEHPEVVRDVDPDLLALLSPNNVGANGNAGSRKASPTTPTFPPSASAGASRLPKARPSSTSIPRTSTSTSTFTSASASYLPHSHSHSHSRSPSDSPSTPHFPSTLPTPSASSLHAPIPSPTTPRPSTSTSTSPGTPPREIKAPVIAVIGSPSSPPREREGGAGAEAGEEEEESTTVTSTPAKSRRVFSLSRSTGSRTGAARLFSPNSMSLSSSSGSTPEGLSNSSSSAGVHTPSSSTTPASKPPRVSTRTLRQVMLSVSTHRAKETSPLAASPPSPHSLAYTPHRGSLDSRRPLSRSAGMAGEGIGLGRPSLDLDRRRRLDTNSLTPGHHGLGMPVRSRAGSTSASPERAAFNREGNEMPTSRAPTEVDSPEIAFEEPSFFAQARTQAQPQGRPRPSLDSARPSFDGYTGSRPGSVAHLRERERDRERDRERENTRERTPSLRVSDLGGGESPSAFSPSSISAASAASPPGGSLSASGSVASAPLTLAARSPSSLSGTGTGPGAGSGVIARMRKRSMSVQERLVSPLRSAGRLGGIAASESGRGGERPGSSLSAYASGGGRRGGWAPEEREREGSLSPGSGLGAGPGPKVELLGPRTVKAFRAAGLLDYDRENSLGNNTTSSTVLAPSPLSGGGGVGGASASASTSALGRFGSMRSASEYHHHSNSQSHARALSRMAFSEAGGAVSESGRYAPGSELGRYGARRGSGTFSSYTGGGSHASALGHGYRERGGGSGNNLMESPTFTASSGSRDRDRDRERGERGERGDRERDVHTPKSTPSTAPTSVSESFGYLGRDRDRDPTHTLSRDLNPALSRDRALTQDREELLALKEKHASDMAALLSALADSQRTTKMLREENAQLRERLGDENARLEGENARLRERLGEENARL
ncbi:hypothetical protein CVT26_008861, partial [Gymnopilus dilepis]